MNHNARRKMLKFPGAFMVTLFLVVLAIWFAYIWVMTEIHSQFRSLTQLALNKTELVISQADLVRDTAQLHQGKICTPAHQKSMPNTIRSRLYISELIYAQGDHFLCPMSMAPPATHIMPTADYRRTSGITVYYYRDTPFLAGYRMTYMQCGNYVAAISPLLCSETMSDDSDLSWGVHDTVVDTFFSASETASIAQPAPLIRDEASTFQ